MSQTMKMESQTGGGAVDSTLGGGGPQECNEKADGSNSTWEDMLKSWSLAQSDGTKQIPAPASMFCSSRPPPPPVHIVSATNNKKTLGGAPQAAEMANQESQTFIVAQRVREISALFKMDSRKLAETGVTPSKFLGLLDELQGYVGSIDIAVELQSIRRLDSLLGSMNNNHAGIRAKTAEVVSAVVNNNPTGQKLVMELGGLHFIMDRFIRDPDETAVAKTLLAISSLFRNNKSAMTVFLRGNGFEDLKYGLNSGCVSSQRRCLNLIQCLLHEHSSECNIVTKVGLHRIMMHLAFSDDADVREAALRCLLVLARVEGGGNSDQLVKNDAQLKQVLQELIIGISAMAPEDLGSAREEIQLVGSLWNACYSDPSPLQEEGLFVLPGEDLCDLASKLFEPSPRALAAADRKSLAQKKKAPFLIAIPRRSAATF